MSAAKYSIKKFLRQGGNVVELGHFDKRIFKNKIKDTTKTVISKIRTKKSRENVHSPL